MNPTLFIIIFIFCINMCLGLPYAWQLFLFKLLLEILFFFSCVQFFSFWDQSFNNCFSKYMWVAKSVCLFFCLKSFLLYFYFCWWFVWNMILGWQLFFLSIVKILFICTLASILTIRNLLSIVFPWFILLKTWI